VARFGLTDRPGSSLILRSQVHVSTLKPTRRLNAFFGFSTARIPRNPSSLTLAPILRASALDSVTTNR